MNTGQRIIQLRSQRNWTQKELAKRVNMNVSVMNRIESGERPIKGDELTAIADTLKVTADYLLGRAEEAPSSAADQENGLIQHIQKISPDAEAMLRDMAVLTSEEIKDVYDYMLFKKSRRKD
ncbi:transcriptional regulator [Oceanobacillus oncorhynchi subsp. incaldanensis]|uniref:helix-turn-helix domain-containing protein n=1 Tax=Oceanobacillus oncorhynchi TaxID=545501 RepID=UPI001B1198C5|nr:helix-turn-helix transcriptional regulator [Oceanobacillus oncorhynchi]GIO20749.1 transcriptional regulator [Oceanobacillus oncorhynchi subsp. incaldanensis]